MGLTLSQKGVSLNTSYKKYPCLIHVCLRHYLPTSPAHINLKYYYRTKNIYKKKNEIQQKLIYLPKNSINIKK
jgi:hypothetical protein